MAKLLPSLINTSGTVAGTTFVQNKLYGPYIRAPRGTYKKAVLNEACQANADKAAPFNLAAKTIYDELRKERHDSELWFRILQVFFKSGKDGKIAPECVLHLECNLPHTVSEVLPKGFQIEAIPYRKKLQIIFKPEEHPVLHKKNADRYSIRFLVIYPDYIAHISKREELESSVQSLSAALLPIEVTVPMPNTKSPFIVLISVRAYDGKKDETSAKENFLHVAAIG